MSKDFIILAPNGRRIKVHCTADTSILQVLEDACAKQGIPPSDYDLKHHRNILDLTTTVRFCNIPNKATLEMVEAEKKRIESNITIGLMLDDGERRTAEFPPNTSLYDLISTLAPSELSALQNPTISYMRQEVTGLPALKEKTLRNFGLIAGRAILRLMDKTQMEQAHVISTHKKVKSDNIDESLNEDEETNKTDENSKPLAGPSGVIKDKITQHSFDPIKAIEKVKEEKKVNEQILKHDPALKIDSEDQPKTGKAEINEIKTNETKTETNVTKTVKAETVNSNKHPKQVMSQENLERRLRIEEEVSFLGSQKAIAFMQPDRIEEELDDLPDDFYELTIEEVRNMFKELQQDRMNLENAPLLTTTKRDEIQKQASQQLLNTYKNAVVRIQFPDNIILQGVFLPSHTIEDVQNFIKEHLHTPHKSFCIFSTPLKETLNPKMTLLEARFVPCVHMHFKWLEDPGQPYLKKEIYLKQTTSDAASILASKYRAPSRRKLEGVSDSSQVSCAGTSKSKQSKVPKWFK